MKQILMLIALFLYAPCLKAQNKVQMCNEKILIDAIEAAVPCLKESPDTIVIKYNEIYYLRAVVKSCKGAMYVEGHLVSGNSMIFNGNYMDAAKLDSIQVYSSDPITGDGNLNMEAHYKAIRVRVWKYYNDKGELIKEEKYDNGRIIASEK